MNVGVKRKFVYGVLLALVSVALTPGANGDFEDCKVCSESVGVMVCLLADEWEVGYAYCYAGPICFYLPGGVEWCFDDACWANDPCETPPGI